jgi:uncharacterized protein (TIGR03118 family)
MTNLSALLRGARSALLPISGRQANNFQRRLAAPITAAWILGCASLATLPAGAQTRFVQTNLLADQAGVAAFTDPRLINAWGLAYAPGGAWFVTATDSGYVLSVDGTGAPNPPSGQTAFTVPPAPGGSQGSPTSVMYNGTTDFQIASGKPATYIFSTEDGTIAGWNASVDPAHAIQVLAVANASYKGMALGQLNGANVLYGANFENNSVDVYNASFGKITLGGGAFVNPAVPSGYAPFNVQYINGKVFVAWAKQNRSKTEDVPGPGHGYVAEFNPDGTLVLQFQHNLVMNSPWGFAIAPSSGFGTFSGKLLVSQFAGGIVSAYDLSTGSYEGFMQNANGRPIVNLGIWAIAFGDGGLNGSATSLYFAAGTGAESHGLFGKFVLQ